MGRARLKAEQFPVPALDLQSERTQRPHRIGRLQLCPEKQHAVAAHPALRAKARRGAGIAGIAGIVLDGTAHWVLDHAGQAAAC
jgi:hypothetical protein